MMAVNASIRYAGDDIDRVLGKFPRNNLLTDLLIKDRAKVLFVGEGNFTFTVAFAAYRKSHAFSITPSLGALLPAGAWEGITSTCYEPAGPVGEVQYVRETLVQCEPPPPTLSEVELQYSVSEIFAKMSINECSSLSNSMKFPSVPAGTWQYGIDATALPTTLTQDKQVIWFQCPWVSRNTGDYSTAALVSDFLLNMAAQIQPGVHVCVGIANHKQYVKRYKLYELLGPNLKSLPNSTPVLKQYEFAGADDQLVRKLLEFGYEHQSVNGTDIHKYIYDSHITLIFTKKEELSVIPVADLHYYHSGKVLFVGEENFTFTVAFAAYRQSKKWSDTPWDGITSTRYEPEGPEDAEKHVEGTLVPCKPAPTLSEVKLQCIASSSNNDMKTIMLINDLPSVPAGTWLYGINPLALPITLAQNQQVIWFQCPWIASYAPQQSTAKLFYFLLNMAAQIQPGVHVCVGMTESSKCVIDNILEAILHLAASDNSTTVLEKYQFVCTDDQLTNSLLGFGYTHESADPTNDCHMTLIFKRKNPYDALPIHCCTDHHGISWRKVLFVGDSTLAMAFAAHQGTWDGITSTRYEPVGPEGEVQYVGKTLVQCKPAPTLSEVKLNCIASCVEDCLNTCDGLQTVLLIFLMCLLVPGGMALTPWHYVQH